MIEFFKLNTRKIIFWGLMIFLTMAVLSGIIAYFGYRSAQFSVNVVLICVVAVPLGFSLLMVILWPVGGVIKLNKRTKVLQITPFSQLGNIGFRPCYMNYGSGNFEALTERSIAAVINGITLTFDIPEDNSNKVQIVLITPMVKKMKISRKVLKNITQKIQHRDAIHCLEYSHGRLNKLYPVDVDTVTISLIKNKLDDFVLFLKSEGFEPSPDPQIKWI